MYGDSLSGDSHTAPSSDLPNLRPSALSSKGKVTPQAPSLSASLLMRSVPAVMFPHWSLPPTCTRTSCSLNRWQKSYPCSSWYENSVKLIPCSESSRVLTESLAIIVPTLAYLPTSRRNSRNPIEPNQSRLFITTAGGVSASAAPLARTRSRIALMPAVLALIVSSSSTGRSALLPEGSPTRPVAPPRSATGCGRIAEPREDDDAEEVPEVERIRGGVEAAVDGQRSLRARLAELVLVGARVEQAALLEDVDDVSLGERGGGGLRRGRGGRVEAHLKRRGARGLPGGEAMGEGGHRAKRGGLRGEHEVAARGGRR